MRIDFKPGNDGRTVKLFSNSAEAIVFWLSLAGLLFLTIIIIFKAVERNRVQAVFKEVMSQQELLQNRIEDLENQNISIKKENEDLKIRYEQLESIVKAPSAKSAAGSTSDTILSPEEREKRNRNKFLEASKPQSQRVKR